jgi:dethiobiotin synthase
VLRGLFVTGTDTNVGKTAVAAALLHRYRAQVSLRYWKPIQTGIEHDDDTAEVRRLTGCGPGDVLSSGVRLPNPVSPHLAARLNGRTIELPRLVQSILAERGRARWIVEGAGGALVPINDSQLMADLIVQLGLPVVVAARSVLGTINHTLLTLEALRGRSLDVAGVVMVGPREPEHRLAIERYGRVAVLGEMPRFDALSREQLAAWSVSELDPQSLLFKLLQ